MVFLSLFARTDHFQGEISLSIRGSQFYQSLGRTDAQTECGSVTLLEVIQEHKKWTRERGRCFI